MGLFSYYAYVDVNPTAALFSYYSYTAYAYYFYYAGKGDTDSANAYYSALMGTAVGL